MSEFTSGPWDIQRSGDGKRISIGIGLVDGPNGYDVAEVYSDDCDPCEAQANANLISAAPDLYHALDDLVAILELDTRSYVFDAVRSARSALTKARGEK